MLKCKTVEKRTRETVDSGGIQAILTKVEAITKIMEYGIMRTPGLVIDNKVVVSGRIPSVCEVNELLIQQTT